MRKIAPAIVLLAFLSVGVFAADISRIAYGDTEQEAKEAAEAELLSYFFGTFVSEVSEVKTYDDGSSSSSSSLFSRSRQAMSGNLLAVEFECVRASGKEKGKGSWKATALIRESSFPLYVTELGYLKKSIRSLKRDAEDESVSALVVFCNALERFENYSQIATVLRPDGDVPKAEWSDTAQSVEMRLQSALIREENELRGADKQNFTSEQLESLRLDLEINRQRQREIDEKNRLDADRRRKLNEENIRARIESTAYVAGRTLPSGNGLADAAGYIGRLKGIVRAYGVATDDYQRLIRDENSRIDSEKEVEVAVLSSRPYRLSECSADGNPVGSAVKAREKDIARLEEKKEGERAKSMSLIRAGAKDRLGSLHDDFSTLRKEFEKKKFESVASSIGPSYEKVSYDANEGGWFVTFSCLSLKLYNVKFFVPYKSLSGKKPVKQNDANREAFEKFSDDVDYYSAILSNFREYYDLEIKYRFYIENGNVYVKFTDVLMTGGENAAKFSVGKFEDMLFDRAKLELVDYEEALDYRTAEQILDDEIEASRKEIDRIVSKIESGNKSGSTAEKSPAFDFSFAPGFVLGCSLDFNGSATGLSGGSVEDAGAFALELDLRAGC